MSANVRIDHCKIKVAGVAMTFRNVLGVVDHVEFIDSGLTNPTTVAYWGGWQAAAIYMPHWGGKDWGHGSWADAPYWGSDKFLFFEDCSFTGVRRHNILTLIDAFEGARYVARNCTFKDAAVGGHGTEGQGRGKKQIECYNNTFVASELIGNAQSCSSGTILVNDISRHFVSFPIKYIYGDIQLVAVRGMKMTIPRKHMNLARVAPSAGLAPRVLCTQRPYSAMVRCWS